MPKATTLTLELNGSSIILDGKRKTVTIKAQTVIIDSQKVLIRGAKGKFKEIALVDVGQHRHLEYGAGHRTGEPVYP